MTVAELYRVSPELKGMLAAWDADRRCPLALVDYLLETDVPGAAACARWCAIQPDAPVWLPSSGERAGSCGPYPSKINGRWLFMGADGGGCWRPGVHPHVVPWDRIFTVPIRRARPIDVIIDLLDVWKEPAPCSDPSPQRPPPGSTPSRRSSKR